MGDIAKYTEYLEQCVDAHINYLQEMTNFISGDSEKRRIQDQVRILKDELKQKLNDYVSQLKNSPADYKRLSIQFKDDCNDVIQRHNQEFQKNVSFWYNISPCIRGFLGILAAIPFFPLLVADTSVRKKYCNTFYNNPQKIYERFFENFTKNFMKIRPLDCLYPITYDSDTNPLINITPEEWSYAKEILKPNGIIAENGTKLSRKDPSHASKGIKHSFIVIDGVIYAQGHKGENPSKEYARTVKYSKDEFGAIWVLKKMAIYPGMSHEDTFANEAKQAQDLDFSNGSVIRECHEGHRKAYLPCVFVRGQRLDAYIKTKKLTIPVAIELMIRILQEIDAFHQGNRTASGNRLKHGDLHSGNIIIGDNGEVKLIDFGRTSDNPNTKAVKNDIIDFRKHVLCPVLISLNKNDQAWVNQINEINSSGSHHSAQDLIESLKNLFVQDEETLNPSCR